MRSILDKYAPVKRRIITLCPSALWYTEEIREEKKKRRRLERRWRSSWFCIDRQMYAEQCQLVLKRAKSSYYSSIISDNTSNQKILFNTIDNLLHRRPEKRYPTASSTAELANNFAEFFHNKIVNIQNALSSQLSISDHRICLADEQTSCKLAVFQRVSVKEVEHLIDVAGLKSCELDPIPPRILKGCKSTLLSTLTSIVNLSLQSACMPGQLKEAMVRPKLKKESLDFEEYSNFRPISNLTFVSKIIERAVGVQVRNHVIDNDLDELLQSAYKRLHSTETALLKVQNDILRAIDDNKCVALLLLDMSSAFDTVDHKFLLERLSNRFGFKGQVLKWFESYLQDRKQFVMIDGVKSVVKDLHFGVPQGSVLGPILCSLYISPLGDIVRHHGLEFHLYADDTQLYFAFRPTAAEQQASFKYPVNE